MAYWEDIKSKIIAMKLNGIEKNVELQGKITEGLINESVRWLLQKIGKTNLDSYLAGSESAFDTETLDLSVVNYTIYELFTQNLYITLQWAKIHPSKDEYGKGNLAPQTSDDIIAMANHFKLKADKLAFVYLNPDNVSTNVGFGVSKPPTPTTTDSWTRQT